MVCIRKHKCSIYRELLSIFYWKPYTPSLNHEKCYVQGNERKSNDLSQPQVYIISEMIKNDDLI